MYSPIQQAQHDTKMTENTAKIDTNFIFKLA